jgi:hypothetical protein
MMDEGMDGRSGWVWRRRGGTGVRVGKVCRGLMALIPRCQDPAILHKEEERRSSAWLQIEQEGKLLKNKDRK